MSHRPKPAQTLSNGTDAVLRPTAYSLQPTASPRSGLTLIEMLVALAVTLVMMAAVVNLFANLSGSIRNRRAVIEVSGQLRQVRQRMALDLAGATCDPRTWSRPGENRGYIEYIEGQYSDALPSILVDGTNNPPNNPELDYGTSLVPRNNLVQDYNNDGEIDDGDQVLHQSNVNSFTPGALGDWDDILALTVRSESDPFRASDRNPVNNNLDTVQSQLAEVVWFAGENGVNAPAPEEPGMRRIYRRVLLIAPWRGPWTNRPENISARLENGRWVANTLGDLTKRENRAFRNPTSPMQPGLFPFPLDNSALNSDQDYLMLGDALAFDIRIYDPGAPLFAAATGAVVQPGDPGWPAAALAARTAATLTNTLSGFGAFVDLGWAVQSSTPVNLYWPPDSAASLAAPLAGLNNLQPGSPSPVFHVPHQPGWHPRNGQVLASYPAVYDTWSFHYENDGYNQDQTHSAPYGTTMDQGTNGLDDDNMLGVDDMGERETSPPYDVPLRGLQVRFRVYERDARQIRETSVTHSFAQ